MTLREPQGDTLREPQGDTIREPQGDTLREPQGDTGDRYAGIFYNHGNFSRVEDILAIEEPLSISINGEPFTVTMRTPGNERELVTGLLFTEEVFRDSMENISIVPISTNSKGFVTAIDVVIPHEKILKDFAGSRNIISASSCGLCGRTSFEDTISKNTIVNHDKLNPAKVMHMFESMSKHQEAFKQSGGTHACAVFTLDGTLLDIQEDIGRHNAVDKVVGSLILNNKLKQARCMTVSGRVSYEIVNKALSAGISFLASVSAPSGMAVTNAKAAGMTLMAFCRNDKLTIYANPEFVDQDSMVQVNG